MTRKLILQDRNGRTLDTRPLSNYKPDSRRARVADLEAIRIARDELGADVDRAVVRDSGLPDLIHHFGKPE